MTQSEASRYAKLMERVVPERGFPLWYPEPNSTLPEECRKTGLQIGDVGVVRADGSFDLFFNICLPENHALHADYGVPEGFTQIHLTDRDLSIYLGDNCDQVISTRSVTSTVIGGSVRAEAQPAAVQGSIDFNFSSSSEEGAILVLPEGSSKHDLCNLLLFEMEALRCGKSWYDFAQMKLGRTRISYDSLYLITGYHKTSSWSLAAFHDTSKDWNFSAKFKAGKIIGGDIHAAYNWELTPWAPHRFGPVPYDGTKNQTVFIRGYKIAVRENPLLSSLRGEVSVLDELPNLADRKVHPSLRDKPWSGSRSENRPTEVHRDAPEDVLPAEVNERHHEDEFSIDLGVSLSQVPPTEKVYHPSDLLIEGIMEINPALEVVVIHDHIWSDMYKIIPQEHDPSKDELIQQICNNYTITLFADGIGYVREHSLFSENMSSASSINLEDPADNKCEPESRMTRSRSFRMYDIDYAEVDQQHPMIPQPKSVIPGHISNVRYPQSQPTQGQPGYDTHGHPSDSQPGYGQPSQGHPSLIDTGGDSVRAEAATPRTLVLCFDGTVGQSDGDNTNVVKLHSLLRKDDTDRQQCYYQPGIGTYFQPGIVSSLFTSFAKLADKAIAWYLDEHIMDGYKFLMRTYRKGDKICLFGFSRGAFTARALAGMLTKVGLLPPDSPQTVAFAYKLYTQTKDIKLAETFKKEFCQDVKVEFVGVWDTVQSTGILVSRKLPFTNSNTAIRTFRHALSLDEHRVKFLPDLYHWSPGEHFSLSDKVMSHMWGFFDFFNFMRRMAPNGEVADYGTFQQASYEPLPSKPETTDVLEVWFAGCHSDIGGGNVENDDNISLGQIPLRWMIEQIIASKCGILFEEEELRSLGITTAVTPDPPATKEPDTGSGLQKRNVGGISESTAKTISSDLEFKDATAQLFDDLQTENAWWLLETLPLTWFWQDANSKWHMKWSIHLGKGRIIPYKRPLFHHTVKLRMDYEPLKYKPRAIYEDDVIYV